MDDSSGAPIKFVSSEMALISNPNACCTLASLFIDLLMSRMMQKYPAASVLFLVLN